MVALERMNTNMKKLRIVMAGGGTGGHLFPAIAIAESFLEKNPQNTVLFVSTGRAFEKTVLTEHGFRLECITAEGIKGKGINIAGFPTAMISATVVAPDLQIIRSAC